MRLPRIPALLALLASSFAVCSAQDISLREVDGKIIECAWPSRAINFRDCGYGESKASLVFVGTITQVDLMPDGERKLKITPDEVFRGHPAATVIAITSQGRCFDHLEAGERWLFNLSLGDNGLARLELNTLNLPIENATESIETLRRLQSIGDRAILRGHATIVRKHDVQDLANVNIVAEDFEKHQEVATRADAEGHFEFPFLFPGNYTVRAELDGKILAQQSIKLRPASCREIAVSHQADGYLGGRLRYADGTPASGVHVLLLQGAEFNATASDRQGYFSFFNVESGAYLIGFDPTPDPIWQHDSVEGGPKISFFYPNTTTPSQAVPIILMEDERRDNFNIKLPFNKPAAQPVAQP